MRRLPVALHNLGVCCLLTLAVLLFTHCGRRSVPPPAAQCGEGFTYSISEQRCIPETLYKCNPSCNSDHRCVKQGDKFVCQPRIPSAPDGQVQQCAVTCGDGQVCENGRCVQAPCNPACKAGEVCANGVCSPTSECIPPCPQTGFVCVVGVCKRLCPASCPKGESCNPDRGICEKPCNPACGSGQFCNNGKCVKIEDKDNDNFNSDRDCNDGDKTINPSAKEVCDGKDNDCDGIVDNIVPKECYNGPKDTLGKGICKSGRTACSSGKEICEGAIVPADKEVCDKKDNDCNGLVDDGLTGCN